MLTVADFLNELTEAEQNTLANAIGSGLHDARKAAECLTDPDNQNVVQLLRYLKVAITELQVARTLVRQRA